MSLRGATKQSHNEIASIRLSLEDPIFPPEADPPLAEDEAGIVPSGTPVSRAHNDIGVGI